MGRVYANGRSILHKGDGNTHTSAAPDVCKVPTPGGPVPTPFVNSAQDSMLTKGSTSVTIEGNPVALTSSELSTSTGDEAGTAGGLISSKFKGKMAWGSGSVDVKVEGKGVVRYLDVTLHNGNTYNTTFISGGRTAWAYGDDAQCTACGKSLDTHRVHEMDDVVVHMDTVFLKLMERLHEQRPLIEEYLRLKAERNTKEQRANEAADIAALALAPRKRRREELISQLNSSPAGASTTIRNELAPLQSEIANTEKKNKERRKENLQSIQSIKLEMDKINHQLENMKPVLTKDESTGTYTKGYMVGTCICKCAHHPRLLAACSGTTPLGFKEAIAATPFQRIDDFRPSENQVQSIKGQSRNKWECAAPKLLQAAGAGGHKARTMSERYFSPILEHQVKVTYSHTSNHGTEPAQEGKFGHGESVPSCTTCQELLPEMLCANQEECS
ncbi:PAAR-like domain-containing protein [Corallococcus terminator]